MNERDRRTIAALSKYNYQVRYVSDSWTGGVKYMFALHKDDRNLYTMLKVEKYLYEEQENFVLFLGFVETSIEKHVPRIDPAHYFHSLYDEGKRLIFIEVGVGSARISDPIDLYDLPEYYDFLKPYFMEEIFG